MTDTSSRKAGILYVVATPIGNLEDISLRAQTILKSVDTILAEDTRHSQRLLTALGIKKPLVALHAHNESTKSEEIVEALLRGQSFALISDAGTPLISDPGYPLVKQARAQQITVSPIPGACALVTALSAAGIPCDTFTFAGFLPAKSTARRHKLSSFLTLEHTVVFYESTHRILESIDDIAAIFGDECEWVLAKELTKTFERFVEGNSATIKAWLQADLAHCKGEFVLIIPPREHVILTSDNEQLLTLLLNELPLKKAVQLACQITHQSKNELYKLALTLQKNEGQ